MTAEYKEAFKDGIKFAIEMGLGQRWPRSHHYTLYSWYTGVSLSATGIPRVPVAH
jgi:hypothetical protein